MAIDIPDEVAKFYDLNPELPDDLPFYRSLPPSPGAAILELGCGTGRVLVPLASTCGYIHGLDASEAMLEICRTKLREAGIPRSRACVGRGSISGFDLGRHLVLIIAPFRVFQNLETDTEIDGLFRSVRGHLAKGGSCVLNAFKPDPEKLRDAKVRGEILLWEVPASGGSVTCHDRTGGVDEARQVLHPRLVYRRIEAGAVREEAVLDLAMRYYEPAQFEEIVTRHRCRIVGRWGGYKGERYGEGPELVLQFVAA